MSFEGEAVEKPLLVCLYLSLAVLWSACGDGSIGDDDADNDSGDADTDSDTDADSDGDTETETVYEGDCEWDEMPPAGYWDWYDICVPVSDQECIEAVSAIIEGIDEFGEICSQGGSGWIDCDDKAEFRCMMQHPGDYTTEILCELTLLECIDQIGGGNWE